MISILEIKSNENLKASCLCIQHKCFNVAASRLYYSIFQKVKGIIYNDSNFLTNYQKKHNKTEQDCFKHGNIPRIIKEYLESKKNHNYNEDEGSEVYKLIGEIYTRRREADYDRNKEICEIVANNLYMNTSKIIDFIDKNNI